MEDLERALLPGAVSADGGGPTGDVPYVYAPHLLSAPAVTVATRYTGVSPTTPCLSCTL